jgi:hypothetical protein
MRHLRGVAIELMRHGCDCRYGGMREEAVPVLEAAGIAALAPPEEGWPPPPDRNISPARNTLNILDTISNFGVGAPETLVRQIAYYDRILDAWQPDLVIGEYAYVAGLAARGRAPFVAIGCTASTVPLIGPVPPGFVADGPQWSWTEETFVATVNDGLARAVRPLVVEPVDVLRSVRQYVMAIPETDLYDGRRDDTLLPPMIAGYDPSLSAGDGKEIFVYLHAFTQANVALLAGLIACGHPVRLFLIDLEPENAEVLAELGIIVESAAVAIADIIGRSRLVIHHGGGQMVALLLAAGVPQIVLAKHFDNSHAGASVSALGLGRWCWHQDVTTSWLVDAVEALTGPDTAARARAAAPAYRAILSQDPAPIIADGCLAILRGGG